MTEEIYSDADLVAFDDGMMADDAAMHLAQRLESDDALKTRLDAICLDRETVAAAFDTLLDQAPSMAPPACAPLAKAVPPQKSFSPWAIAASLVLALGLGALGHRAIAPDRALDWQELAAAYHALYTTETLTALAPPDAETTTAQLQRAGAALGHDVPAGLTNIDGLSFRRAQVLGHGGTAIIQLSYLDGAGVPYAFCLRAAGTAGSSDMQARGFAGVQGVGWQAGGIDYVLLANRPLKELETLSGVFLNRL